MVNVSSIRYKSEHYFKKWSKYICRSSPQRPGVVFSNTLLIIYVEVLTDLVVIWNICSSVCITLPWREKLSFILHIVFLNVCTIWCLSFSVPLELVLSNLLLAILKYSFLVRNFPGQKFQKEHSISAPCNLEIPPPKTRESRVF